MPYETPAIDGDNIRYRGYCVVLIKGGAQVEVDKVQDQCVITIRGVPTAMQIG